MQEKKFKAQLRIKIETAKFLQETLDEMAVSSKGETHSDTAKEFSQFFDRVYNFLKLFVLYKSQFITSTFNIHNLQFNLTVMHFFPIKNTVSSSKLFGFCIQHFKS